MVAVNPDRNLLFGLLALQNGLIDQVQLVAAFQAWTRAKGKALADHFIDRGDLDPDQRSVIDAMVSLHVKKHGNVEKSLAAVPTNRSARARLAALGEPEIEATLARITRSTNGPATDAEDVDPSVRAPLPAARASPTVNGFASSARTRGAARAPSLWRSMAS